MDAINGFAAVKRALRVITKTLIDSRYRNLQLMRIRRPRGLFQPYATTVERRYPHIFEFVRIKLGNHPARILSFGCSTGEEVFTLRKCFPAATIKGIDINPDNIAQCTDVLGRNPDSG